MLYCIVLCWECCVVLCYVGNVALYCVVLCWECCVVLCCVILGVLCCVVLGMLCCIVLCYFGNVVLYCVVLGMLCCIVLCYFGNFVLCWKCCVVLCWECCVVLLVSIVYALHRTLLDVKFIKYLSPGFMPFIELRTTLDVRANNLFTKIYIQLKTTVIRIRRQEF